MQKRILFLSLFIMLTVSTPISKEKQDQFYCYDNKCPAETKTCQTITVKGNKEISIDIVCFSSTGEILKHYQKRESSDENDGLSIVENVIGDGESGSFGLFIVNNKQVRI